MQRIFFSALHNTGIFERNINARKYEEARMHKILIVQRNTIRNGIENYTLQIEIVSYHSILTVHTEHEILLRTNKSHGTDF